MSCPQRQHPARKQVRLRPNLSVDQLFESEQNPITHNLQVETPVTGTEDHVTSNDINIWTGRSLTSSSDSGQPRGSRRHISAYRCNPHLDQGWTRGEAAKSNYCCLHFARGLCHRGASCIYLHRIPTVDIEQRHAANLQFDIFGRDRLPLKTHFSTKGAGDVSKFNTTLFIHYGTAGILPENQLRKLLVDNFQIWGPLDGTVNLIYKKNIAFFKYKWRSSAEFAKVAMHQQTLLVLESIEEEGEEKRGGGDNNKKNKIKVPADAQLDVRWALDDANPVAVAKVKRQHEEAFVAAYTTAADALGPDAKVARMHELTMMAAHQPGALVSQYPDTDEQYNVSNREKEEEEGEEEEEEEDVGYDEEDINDEDKEKKGAVLAELLGGYGDDDDGDQV